MEVRVRLFGPAAELAGAGAVTVQVDPGCDEAALRSRLGESVPALAPLARQGRLAINHAFARPGQVVTGGDEVALIAMVSGG